MSDDVISVLQFSNGTVRGGLEEHILMLLRGFDDARPAPVTTSSSTIGAALKNLSTGLTGCRRERRCRYAIPRVAVCAGRSKCGNAYRLRWPMHWAPASCVGFRSFASAKGTKWTSVDCAYLF